MLSDRLPRLAEDADIARLRVSAEHPLALAEGVPYRAGAAARLAIHHTAVM